MGSHDLCPTLLELLKLSPIPNIDAKSFAPVLSDPNRHSGAFTEGFAEYFGSRYMLTQRVVYSGDWKYVHNGFDIDELYHLAYDPFELRNLAESPEHRGKLREMIELMWKYVRQTGDHSLLNTDYPPLRLAAVGPAVEK